MIQKETELIVADNSGAKVVRCFHIVGSTGRRFAYVGDIIICAVKKAIPGGKVKKGDIITAVIVRVRKEYRRRDGSYIRFGDNAVVLIQSLKEQVPVGTRVFGPIARELRDSSCRDIVPLAPEVW